jgi:hypothetical protein
MKKAIVFGIMIVCIGLMYWFPHSTISPGELVEGHQNLNSDCFACHTAFKGISNEKCISCHKLSDIGKDTTAISGESGIDKKILFHKNLSGQNCTSCHTDHKGIHPLTSLSSFKHDMLSQAVISNCNNCHNKPTDNLHRLLSSNCNDCHTTSAWKLEAKFDHSLIVATEKNNCVSCHKSPDDSFHASLKDNCDKCHTTEKWKPSTFDHSNYFVLDKDHNVECNTCHTNNNFKIYTCYGCHEHSESKIIEEHREEGISNITNCVSCHKSSDEDDIRMQDNVNKKINKNDYNKVRDVIKKDKKDHNKKDDD